MELCVLPASPSFNVPNSRPELPVHLLKLIVWKLEITTTRTSNGHPASQTSFELGVLAKLREVSANFFDNADAFGGVSLRMCFTEKESFNDDANRLSQGANSIGVDTEGYSIWNFIMVFGGRADIAVTI